MTSAKEFRKRAAECRRMSEAAGDGIMRGLWARLADRWLTCAALAEPQEDDQTQTSH